MSLINSTGEKVLAMAVAALLVLSIAFGGLWWYRGTVIESQEKEIATQKEALDNYAKDKDAQGKADKQLAKDKAALEADRKKFKQELEDALEGNICADTALPDDAKRVLKELYGSQGSR